MTTIEEIRKWKAEEFERYGLKWMRYTEGSESIEIQIGASIGDGASIGYGASIGDGDKYLYLGPLGSRKSVLTLVLKKDEGLQVHTGCFHGPVDTFLDKVTTTHGDNDYAREYRAAIAFAREVLK